MSPGISCPGGGSAQTSFIKKTLRIVALAQYRELASASPVRLRSRRDDPETLNTVARVTELMKQRQYAPMSI